MLEIDQPESPDSRELLARVKGLPRVRDLGEVDPVKIYLGWTTMPPNMMEEPRCRHALFGPFESRDAAEAASTLMRTFCHACGTGLIMGDVFTGDGKKFNNCLIDVSCYIDPPGEPMDVSCYIEPPGEPKLASQPRLSLWTAGLQFPVSRGEM